MEDNTSLVTVQRLSCLYQMISRGLTGLEGLLVHLEKRKALEHRIIDEIFKENTFVVQAKHYVLEDIKMGRGN